MGLVGQDRLIGGMGADRGDRGAINSSGSGSGSEGNSKFLIPGKNLIRLFRQTFVSDCYKSQNIPIKIVLIKLEFVNKLVIL